MGGRKFAHSLLSLAETCSNNLKINPIQQFLTLKPAEMT